MERLTERDYNVSDGGAYLKCSEGCAVPWCDGCSNFERLVDRLAAYEDTGLEPSEVKAKCAWADKMCKTLSDIFGDSGVFDFSHFKELSKAESEGRLLVLPCNVGDTVYLPTKNDWGDLLSFEVIEIGVDRDGPFFVIDDEEHDHIPMSDIGADVFLSREEAEEALAKEAT